MTGHCILNEWPYLVNPHMLNHIMYTIIWCVNYIMNYVISYMCYITNSIHVFSISMFSQLKFHIILSGWMYIRLMCYLTVDSSISHESIGLISERIITWVFTILQLISICNIKHGLRDWIWYMFISVTRIGERSIQSILHNHDMNKYV